MKKVIMLVGLLFLVGMLTSVSAQTQSGSFYVDSNTPNFTLSKNEGSRSVEVEVRFAQPFDTMPNVVVANTLIDAAKDTKIRYSVEPKAVSRDGFVIKVSVWGDTQLNAVGGSWLAHTK